MSLAKKSSSKSYDDTKSASQKDLSKSVVSYQEERKSESKMGPTSSTVEGTK